MSTIRWCGPMKIDDAWISYSVERFGGAMPTCRYCGKTVRKGGYADHLWPYHDEFSYHIACYQRSLRKGIEVAVADCPGPFTYRVGRKYCPGDEQADGTTAEMHATAIDRIGPDGDIHYEAIVITCEHPAHLSREVSKILDAINQEVR